MANNDGFDGNIRDEIAVETIITAAVDQEFENIKKCLAATFEVQKCCLNEVKLCRQISLCLLETAHFYVA